MIGFCSKDRSDVDEKISQCFHYEDPQTRMYYRHLNYTTDPRRRTFASDVDAYLQYTRQFKERCLGFVVHLTTKSLPIDVLYQNISKALNCFKEFEYLLIENSWSPRDHGSTIEELATLFNMFEDKSHIGICIDTSHLYLAGYSLKERKDVISMLARFDELIGLKHLRLVHFNDIQGDHISHHTPHLPIFHGNVFTIESFLILRDFFLTHNTNIILERTHADISELKLFTNEEIGDTESLKSYFMRVGVPKEIFRENEKLIRYTKQDIDDIIHAEKAMDYFHTMSILCQELNCPVDYSEKYNSLTLRKIPAYINTLIGLDVPKIMTCCLLSKETKLELITKTITIDSLSATQKRWFDKITINDLIETVQALKLPSTYEVLGSYSRYLAQLYKQAKSKSKSTLSTHYPIDNTIDIFTMCSSVDYQKCLQTPPSIKIQHYEIIHSCLYVYVLRASKCYILKFVLGGDLSQEQLIIKRLLARGNSTFKSRLEALVKAKGFKLIKDELWHDTKLEFDEEKLRELLNVFSWEPFFVSVF